ncbi:MAG: response regulator [Labilibaculum antarcticum]
MKKDFQEVIPTVLVVDDNPKNIQIIALILRELNYKITIAVDGQTAIDLVDRVRPDLILLDVMMPGMDGFEACKIIKSKTKNENIPIIFLTALSEKVNIVKGFENGGVDYIVKPFNKEELISRIKTHLELKFARDEMQRLTNHLRELNSIKDKMFSVIGHDLRSPIGSMKMIIDNLLSKADKYADESLIDSVEILSKTSDEVFNLLENLLWWARSQSKAVVIYPENLELEQIVSSIYYLNKGSFKLKKINFKQVIDKDCTVLADINILKTILRNLLSNALKFTPEGGQITLEAYTSGEFVSISIIDTGVGIPANKIPLLFDEKGHLTTFGTNNESGSGLGLKLCGEFVKSSNGHIHVKSEIGLGSTFTIEIPKGITVD